MSIPELLLRVELKRKSYDSDFPDDEIDIRFSQKIPEGYRIIWDIGSEHYQWKRGHVYSEVFCDRWMAYRSAWKNYKQLNQLNK